MSTFRILFKDTARCLITAYAYRTTIIVMVCMFYERNKLNTTE